MFVMSNVKGKYNASFSREREREREGVCVCGWVGAFSSIQQ